jgi:hypothetical protein
MFSRRFRHRLTPKQNPPHSSGQLSLQFARDQIVDLEPRVAEVAPAPSNIFLEAPCDEPAHEAGVAVPMLMTLEKHEAAILPAARRASSDAYAAFAAR